MVASETGNSVTTSTRDDLLILPHCVEGQAMKNVTTSTLINCRKAQLAEVINKIQKIGVDNKNFEGLPIIAGHKMNGEICFGSR